MYGHMKSRYKYVKNNGVKKAPFYVLLGAQMPAILVETSLSAMNVSASGWSVPHTRTIFVMPLSRGFDNILKKLHPIPFQEDRKDCPGKVSDNES